MRQPTRRRSYRPESAREFGCGEQLGEKGQTETIQGMGRNLPHYVHNTAYDIEPLRPRRRWTINPDAAYYGPEFAAWGGELGRTACAERRCRWEYWNTSDPSGPQYWSYEIPCPHSEGLWPERHLITVNGRTWRRPATIISFRVASRGQLGTLRCDYGISRETLVKVGRTLGVEDPLPLAGAGEHAPVADAADLAWNEIELWRLRNTLNSPRRSSYYRTIETEAREIAGRLAEKGYPDAQAEIRGIVEAHGGPQGPRTNEIVALLWWDLVEGRRPTAEAEVHVDELLGW